MWDPKVPGIKWANGNTWTWLRGLQSEGKYEPTPTPTSPKCEAVLFDVQDSRCAGTQASGLYTLGGFDTNGDPYFAQNGGGQYTYSLYVHSLYVHHVWWYVGNSGIESGYRSYQAHYNEYTSWPTDASGWRCYTGETGVWVDVSIWNISITCVPKPTAEPTTTPEPTPAPTPLCETVLFDVQDTRCIDAGAPGLYTLGGFDTNGNPYFTHHGEANDGGQYTYNMYVSQSSTVPHDHWRVGANGIGSEGALYSQNWRCNVLGVGEQCASDVYEWYCYTDEGWVITSSISATCAAN